MTTQFFIPTAQQIQLYQVGDLAPDYTGRLKPIVSIFTREQDINSKWFICYYVKHGDSGKVSHSLKEGKLDRSLSLTKLYTSHQLDEIERKLTNE